MSNTEPEKNDKEAIQIEEREKMMNEENKAQDLSKEESNPKDTIEKDESKEKEKEKEAEATKPSKTDSKEGREVKPKKIPIGGIQMPGFFTRSKSKERCKDADNETGDTEGTELLETDKKEEKKDEKPEEKPSRIKLPFMRKTKSQGDEEKSGEPSQRKRLIDTIRLPLVSVFPRRSKTEDKSSTAGGAQAGLASMETLGDDIDKGAGDQEMKNVKLDDSNKTDVEKQEMQEEPNWRTKLRAYRVVISAVLLFVLLFIIILAVAIPGRGIPSAISSDGRFATAVTSCGLVEGILEDSAYAFRGIPYARSPIENNRWTSAQPLDSINYCWNGTFKAHTATPLCSQLTNNTVEGVEDCLTLDIVTPYVRYENPLPVIVMIGSDSLMGGTPGKMRPSARYARSRDVIFVRPNFRVGPLGFLALEALSNDTHPPTSGNYGLSDIVQALKWVQMNIEHFGGNPKSVILFGHKAGATLVTALTYSSVAKGLFARAWATSGGVLYPGKLLKDSERNNKNYLDSFICDDNQTTIDCLRTQSVDNLIQAVPDIWRKDMLDLPTIVEESTKKHEWLVLDGKILKEHPAEVWTKEDKPKIPLVLGTTAHAAASDYLLLRNENWTPELIKQHISDSLLGKLNLTDEILTKYSTDYQGLVAMVSDIRVVCPLLAISTQQKSVPFYVVTQTRGEQNVSDVDSDVDAILGRYEPHTPEQRRYVAAIQQLFYHYVWHGEVLQTENLRNNKVLVVGQDVLPSANYSYCDFWINKNIVPKYAQVD